jgi:hypothetical protein
MIGSYMIHQNCGIFIREYEHFHDHYSKLGYYLVLIMELPGSYMLWFCVGV